MFLGSVLSSSMSRVISASPGPASGTEDARTVPEPPYARTVTTCSPCPSAYPKEEKELPANPSPHERCGNRGVRLARWRDRAPCPIPVLTTEPVAPSSSGRPPGLTFARPQNRYGD